MEIARKYRVLFILASSFLSLFGSVLANQLVSGEVQKLAKLKMMERAYVYFKRITDLLA